MTICLICVHLISHPEPEIVCPDLPCNGGMHYSWLNYWFIVLTGCSSVKTNLYSFITEPSVAPCVQRPVDLVFLLDGSERLGTKNFQHVREFLQKVSEHLGLARSNSDRLRARLALIEYGSKNHVAFGLTHDPAAIADGIARLAYQDSASSAGPAIIYTIDNVLGKGNTRQTRRHAEISFVFITDGIFDKTNLEEAVSAMRGAQVVSTVIAPGNDVDQEVLMKLAMGDQHAIFKGKDMSELSQSSLFDRFIRWVC